MRARPPRALHIALVYVFFFRNAEFLSGVTRHSPSARSIANCVARKKKVGPESAEHHTFGVRLSAAACSGGGCGVWREWLNV